MPQENYALAALYRNGSALGQTAATSTGVLDQLTAVLGNNFSFIYPDNPGTTSAVSYQIYCAVAGAPPVNCTYSGGLMTLLEIV